MSLIGCVNNPENLSETRKNKQLKSFSGWPWDNMEALLANVNIFRYDQNVVDALAKHIISIVSEKANQEVQVILLILVILQAKLTAAEAARQELQAEL